MVITMFSARVLALSLVFTMTVFIGLSLGYLFQINYKFEFKLALYSIKIHILNFSKFGSQILMIGWLTFDLSLIYFTSMGFWGFGVYNNNGNEEEEFEEDDDGVGSKAWRETQVSDPGLKPDRKVV